MLARLRALDPMQRMALIVGVPVVALVVIINRRNAPAPEEAPPADTDAATVAPGVPTAGWVMPSTDAIGTGVLSDFLSQINANQSAFLSTLTDTLKSQEETVTPPPVTPPPVTPPRPPSPGPTKPPVIDRPPVAPNPVPVAAYNPHNDPQLGKRSAVVAGGGESIGALSARLFKSAQWWQELYYLNAAAWNAYAESKGQRITAASFVIPGGGTVKY